MTNKKYIIYPGFVTSQWDGERHYINARKLMILYNVHPNECVIADELFPQFNIYGLIPLRPSYSGNYSLGEKT